MVRVTVSGHPGSGTSTLVAGLSQAKGWRSLNGGDIFRAAAKSRGVSLEAFSNLCKADATVDQELDRTLQQEMSDPNGAEIIESRLAGWWAHRLELDCVRIWVEVSEDERASRVVAREGGDIETQRAKGRERMAADGARYLDLYDIDIDERTPYDCIIDADDLNILEVLAAALSHLEDHA